MTADTRQDVILWTSFGRFALQESNYIRTVGGIRHLISHFLSRDESLRIGQPAVERLVIPYDRRTPKRRGIFVALHASGLSAVDTAMLWPDAILVERVARDAAYRVELLAVRRVARRAGGSRGKRSANRVSITLGMSVLRIWVEGTNYNRRYALTVRIGFNPRQT